jgi:two-component system, OmpR family, response regulator RpaA
MPTRRAIIATTASWGQDCAALCAAHGVEARMMDDGLDVLMAALASGPEIIVYDAGLPGVDGVSLCRKLKQQARLAQVEVLLLIDGASADAIGGCASLDAHCTATVKELQATLASVLTGVGAAAPCGPAPAPASAPEPSGQPPLAGRPKILIVDDDRDLLRGLQIRLRAYDVDVATETGGRDALYTALSIKPDVIVTDYSMPEGSAEYFLLRLKKEEALRDVPIIVMTGWTFDGSPDVAHERDMLGRCGASVYLRKPVEFPMPLAELECHVPMRSKVEAGA